MNRSIVPIVEGFSEVDSIPVLMRRLLNRKEIFDIQAARPIRIKRSKIVKRKEGRLTAVQAEVEHAIQLALRAREGTRAILIIIDADDDCPVELGGLLLDSARSRTQLPVAVIIANRETECWLLGCKESLRGKRGIGMDAENPPNPESIRGAKERLSRNMKNRSYRGTIDQPAMMAGMNIDMARENCPSFDKFLRDFDEIVDRIRSS